MKIMKLAFLIGILGSTYSATAATSSTIKFIGEIVDNTCVIDTASEDLTVPMPTVSSNAFIATGDTAGPQNFSITVTDCETTNVALYFNPSLNTNNVDGQFIKNSTGSASNVAIALYRSDNSTLIDMSTSQPLSDTVNVPSSGSEAVFNFYAKYIATSSVVNAGSVAGKINYEIIYP